MATARAKIIEEGGYSIAFEMFGPDSQGSYYRWIGLLLGLVSRHFLDQLSVHFLSNVCMYIVQGVPSGCALPFVDFKTKVLPQY